MQAPPITPEGDHPGQQASLLRAQGMRLLQAEAMVRAALGQMSAMTPTAAMMAAATMLLVRVAMTVLALGATIATCRHAMSVRRPCMGRALPARQKMASRRLMATKRHMQLKLPITVVRQQGSAMVQMARRAPSHQMPAAAPPTTMQASWWVTAMGLMVTGLQQLVAGQASMHNTCMRLVTADVGPAAPRVHQ